MNLLITGGAGFIGSNLVHHVIDRPEVAKLVNLDCLTYAGHLANLEKVSHHPKYTFEKVDLRDKAATLRVLEQHRITHVMHLAAESHVDRSITGPGDFVHTNVVGTYNLLEACRVLWLNSRLGCRFHHVSTDEVFGSLGPEGLFTEETPYRPSSPYSASKAASDHLVRAWHHTYGLPVLTSNCSNNYGPYQFPEKLIPLCIIRALRGQELPVYGTGANVRDWLYVDDHARALETIVKGGTRGESYNVGGRSEKTNLEVVRELCGLLDLLSPDAHTGPRTSLVRFVTDRPGHDQRYAIDASRVQKALGWAPRETFASGLRKTVEWYLANRTWWERILDGRYRGERIGLGTAAP